jgi:hypothetical protein
MSVEKTQHISTKRRTNQISVSDVLADWQVRILLSILISNVVAAWQIRVLLSILIYDMIAVDGCVYCFLYWYQVCSPLGRYVFCFLLKHIYQAANTSDISIDNKIRICQTAKPSDVSRENKTHIYQAANTPDISIENNIRIRQRLSYHISV